METKKTCKECGGSLSVPSWKFCDEVFCRGRRYLKAYKKRFTKKKDKTPKSSKEDNEAES